MEPRDPLSNSTIEELILIINRLVDEDGNLKDLDYLLCSRFAQYRIGYPHDFSSGVTVVKKWAANRDLTRQSIIAFLSLRHKLAWVRQCCPRELMLEIAQRVWSRRFFGLK